MSANNSNKEVTMNIEKSETLQCLINAFAGESISRNKYTFYSKIAKKEGYNLI